MKKTVFLGVAGLLVLTACGQGSDSSGTDGTGGPSVAPPPIGVADVNGLVIRSRAQFQISTDGDGETVQAGVSASSSPMALSASFSQPITVVNAPSSRMTLDISQFRAPTILNALLDFGFLQVASLLDNELKVCGSNGKQRCTKALIRMYTTGKPKAGLYNADDDYGAPITASADGSSPVVVGLNASAAAVVQTINIASTKNVLRQTDFTPVPKYNVQVDFTNAGAGTYSSTLVVEYVLAP